MSGRQAAGRLSETIVHQLRAGGFDLRALPTQGPGDASRLAAEVVAESTAEIVFAMGGDGTAREIAVGLIGSDVALGVIPGGTANVLARALGIPGQPLAAARCHPSSVIRHMDVGMIGDELFLMQVSAGLDARIMAQQNATLKRWFGRLAFALSGLRTWWTYDYRPMTLKLGDGERTVYSFAACNIPHYGGDFRMAPNASIFDRQLDLVASTAATRSATLGFAKDLLLGRHLRRSDAMIDRVARFELAAPRRIEVQLDGDVQLIEAPCTVRVAEQKLAVLIPRRSGQGE